MNDTIFLPPQKSHSDPRLQETAQELNKAQREVETLQSQLHSKNKLLRDQVVRTDRSQGTIGKLVDIIGNDSFMLWVVKRHMGHA